MLLAFLLVLQRPVTDSAGLRHANGVPLAANAAAIASRVAKPSLVTASIPPASKKFLANVARAEKSASVPRLARNTFGRDPLAASARSDASRSRS